MLLGSGTAEVELNAMTLKVFHSSSTASEKGP